MDKKIVLLGAGSGYFEAVIGELCNTPELAGCKITLYDISTERMELIHQVGLRLIEHTGADLTITEATTDIASALDGADFCISSIGVHGPNCKYHLRDSEVCAEFGIMTTTGDTVGPSGISQGLRIIPIFLEIARQMEKYCPDAILLNHSNPMSQICRAVTKATKINVIGYCHNVAGACGYFAKLLDVPEEEVDITATGPNHMLWVLGATHNGVDVYDEIKKRILEGEPGKGHHFGKKVLELFDLYPVGGDRHIVEFFPHARSYSTVDEIPYGMAWRRDMIMDGRLKAEIADEPTDLEKRAKGEAPLVMRKKPSPESMGQQIRAMSLNKEMVHYVNTTNHGAVPNLPEWAVVELKASIGTYGARPISLPPLPAQAARWSSATFYSHELVVDAAIEGCRKKALMAMACDPMLTNLNDVEPLFDAIVEAQEDRLAQFRKG